MLIKFKKPDPRAGLVVRMDSSLGQQFIDQGAAVLVKDGAQEAEAPTAGGGKPSEGLKVDELKAALTEKGIAIPDGAKKQDLADLLDNAA
jgi:hypothetical protein